MAGSAPGEDRLAAARHLADRVGAVVLLKGALTTVAAPQEESPDVLLASAGGPALAAAGTGDVLSGVIGAFFAAVSRRIFPRPWVKGLKLRDVASV